MEKKDNILLFVYGTLMSGFGNNHLLDNQKLIGEGETNDEYAMYGSIIPFVNKNEKVSKIKGELYEVKSSDIYPLDRLEGHPHWYKREKISVKVNNEDYEAWLYFNNDEKGSLITDGNYKNYRSKLR